MGECFLYGNGFPGPYNGDVSTSIVKGVLKKGYTDGGAIANLVPENVANGINIGGIVGSHGKSYSGSIKYDHVGSKLDSYTFSGLSFKPRFIAVQIEKRSYFQTFFCDGLITYWTWGGGGYGAGGVTKYNSYNGVFQVSFTNTGFEVRNLYYDFYDGDSCTIDIFALS